MGKRKVVVLTGAGISAESGIPTFRSDDGLWAGHDVSKVATPEGWRADKKLVLDFYNERRKTCLKAKPNSAHTELARLEAYFDVTIITQNSDNLHEKAGSSKIVHLHGELFRSRSTVDPRLTYDIDGWELKEGDLCEKGSQLRPDVVWFGEMVPMMDIAVEEAMEAEIFIVIGTSLLVYPAASLVDYVDKDVPIYVVDPNIPNIVQRPNMHFIEDKASLGIRKVADDLIQNYVLKM